MVTLLMGTYTLRKPGVCRENGRFGIQDLGCENMKSRVKSFVLRWVVEDGATLQADQ